MSFELQNLKRLEKQLARLQDEDEEGLLKLVAEYELLFSQLKSDELISSQATVFSHQLYERVLLFNNDLINKLKKLKNDKYQLVNKINLGKKMQISYGAC